MKNNHLKFSNKNWFSPKYVIDSLGKDKNIKKHKELWIAAVYAIARAKLEKIEHELPKEPELWIQFNENDPPDTRIMTLRSGTMCGWDIEVFEISNFEKNSIENSILKKTKDKQYGENVCVVGFVCRQGILEENVVEKLKSNGGLFGQIALISRTHETEPIFRLDQIYPELGSFHFILNNSEVVNNQNPFVRMSRSGIKSKNLTDVVAVEMFPN